MKTVRLNHLRAALMAAAAAGLLAAVALLVVVEVRPAEATFPDNAGKIVYSGQDPSGGDREIYTINAVGGGRSAITDNATDDYDPSYSPSGDRIVYSGQDGPGGDYEIYTMNLLGGNKVKVTNNLTNDRDPSYTNSAKVTKIVYEGYDRHGHDYEIYTILDPAYGRSKGVKVTNNATDDSDPSYSPDSEQITYSGEHTPTGSPTGDYEIYTINTLGNNKYQVTDNTTNDYSPSWGSSVVVGMKPPPPAQLSQP